MKSFITIHVTSCKVWEKVEESKTVSFDFSFSTKWVISNIFFNIKISRSFIATELIQVIYTVNSIQYILDYKKKKKTRKRGHTFLEKRISRSCWRHIGTLCSNSEASKRDRFTWWRKTNRWLWNHHQLFDGNSSEKNRFSSFRLHNGQISLEYFRRKNRQFAIQLPLVGTKVPLPF